jgi:hypothetical protein
MVDLGAVSQRKRSPGGRPDSGPSVQAFSRSGVTYRVTVTCSSTRQGYSVSRSPNAGNWSALNVVISAITPSSIRMTSNLNARNTLSPGRRR